MSISHIVQQLAEDADIAATTRAETAEERAFALGYHAGQEDALRTEEEAETQTVSQAAERLRDLQFTYDEAYASALVQLLPLIKQVLQTLYAAALPQSVALQLSDILHAALTDETAAPLSIEVSPATMPACCELLSRTKLSTGGRVALQSDPALADGQMRVRAAAGASQIDFGAVQQAVSSTLQAHLDVIQKELSGD